MRLLTTLLITIAPALAAALLAAAAGTLDDLASGAPGFADPALLLAPAGVTAAYLAGLGGLSLLAAAALGRYWRGFEAIGFGLMAWLGLYTFFFAPFEAYPVPLPTRQSAETLPVLALTGIAGMLLGGAWARQSEDAQNRTIATLAGAAIGLLAALPAVWYWKFPLGGDPPVALLATALAASGAALGRLAWSGRAPLVPAAALAALTVGVAAGALAARGVPPARPPAVIADPGPAPDVFLITVDTLRADAVFREPSQTPNLDALAADSVIFEHAVSGGPWTPPGLTSILTGLAPAVHGRVRFTSPPLVDALPTLGVYFDEQGWTTAAVGSNPFIQLLDLDRGFQWRHTHAHLSLGRSFGSRVLEQISPRFLLDPSTTQLVDWALQAIRAGGPAPSLLWLHILDPHEPYEPPVRFIDPEQAHPRVGLRFFDPAMPPIHNHDFDRPIRDWIRELYDGEVRYVDEQVGRFLERLRQDGLYDDALIVFTSDHGEEFWEHGSDYHGQSLYDELIHVPLMVKLPRSTVVKRVDSYVSTVAVTPTILDLAGVPYDPERLSEASLRPYLESEPNEPEPAFSSGLWHRENRYSVVLDGKKYIRWPIADIDETYDLRKNPRELPRGFDEEFAERAHTLLEQHLERSRKLRESYGVPDPREADLDPATLERLRGLGYIQ